MRLLISVVMDRHRADVRLKLTFFRIFSSRPSHSLLVRLAALTFILVSDSLP